MAQVGSPPSEATVMLPARRERSPRRETRCGVKVVTNDIEAALSRAKLYGILAACVWPGGWIRLMVGCMAQKHDLNHATQPGAFYSLSVHICPSMILNGGPAKLSTPAVVIVVVLIRGSIWRGKVYILQKMYQLCARQ